ncbi:sugar kinase [Alteromonas sp. C1M14]|uniref:sugar kinase n=1 Tax=Alteromonas sp. C1M14 TaxID=2841567 RepID=UPI001C088EB3|nr:sugar kinase [Alteromonas sp. C1M14]MBU2978353.1 sugar kinase [Alteromonas sp. C1M14]
MKTIYFIGECMVELRENDEDMISRSYAGDVYNSAVYLKRCFTDTQTAVVTAIGEDSLSTKMLSRFKDEGLDTTFVFRHPDKNAGMYYIETDDTGERSFTYWRSDSAAKKVVRFLNDDVIRGLAGANMFFISGISLAVIDAQDRGAFWLKMKALKEAGVTIVFDPNYRARLWQSEDEAAAEFKQAFSLCDIALPGVEDLTVLFGVNTAEEALAFCHQYDIAEVIVKNGPESVITSLEGQQQNHPIVPVTNVVDTTSAGDAFNGVYLGARLNGRAIDEAVQLAAKAAGTVIQHPGAIAPKDAFTQAMAACGL